MDGGQNISLDTGQIRSWRSIVTLLVFILTSKCRLFMPKQIVSHVINYFGQTSLYSSPFISQYTSLDHLRTLSWIP